ncbi:MAG TPA: hypothetical protein VGD66_05345 [Allosphingosinicella sp.]
MQDEIKFHTDRAMSELALASGTANPEAARAHLRLSGLHLDRLRQLCEPPAAGSLSRAAGRGAA